MTDRRSARADLASVSSTLDELTARVTASVEGLGDDDEHVRAALYDVERSLRAAGRRLDTVLRQLG
jgi:hypothetical protein